MAAQLRIVKERVRDEYTERDLRGLGNEHVFKSFYPQCVLTEIKTSSHASLLADAHKLNVVVTESKTHTNHVHYSFATPPHLFKSQAVTLFTLLLKNTKVPFNEGHFCLWQSTPFKATLLAAINGTPDKGLLSLDDFWRQQDYQKSHYLWVDPSCTMHLKQADFNIMDVSEKGLRLHAETCHELYKFEQHKLAEQYTQTKKSERL